MPFDERLADRAVEWFGRYLHHTKGEWGGKPFQLIKWQRDVLRELYGRVRPDGFRQYRTLYLEVPKKQGKSELAAGIALNLTFADHEPGAEVYSAAADREQAAIVFALAAAMVRMCRPMHKRCKILDSTKRILHRNSNYYRVLSSDVPTKHGLNCHGVIFDELHAQPNDRLWNVLTQGAGDARRQPLNVALTTAGFAGRGIAWKIHEYARKVRDGIIKDPTFLPVIYGAEPEADWHDENVWYKANPSLGITVAIERLREHHNLALVMPDVENDFRRLRLDQWVKQVTRFIPMDLWAKCGGVIDEQALRGRACYGGLDLSSVTDITSFVLLFLIDNSIVALPRFWLPEDNLQKRVEHDRVPYDKWVEQGYIKLTPGAAIDTDFIEHDINEASRIYDIREIAYDRWGAIAIAPHLENEGHTMVQFGQGWPSMNGPTQALLTAIIRHALRHGDNPVLTWMADNLAVRKSPTEAVKPDKAGSTERIDGIVAMIMALDRLLRNEGLESAYTADRGLIIL